MKTKILFALILCCTFFRSLSATYTISVSDFAFTPATLTVHPGDIITWVWVNGTHTTTSTTIPSGAMTWDSPITSSATTFSYTVPAVIGTYSYKCTPHASMGMTGTFTVSAASVQPPTVAPALAVYPNPASSVLNISLPQPSESASVAIFDIAGSEIFKSEMQPGDAHVNVANMPAGVYVLYVKQESATYRKEITITH